MGSIMNVLRTSILGQAAKRAPQFSEIPILQFNRQPQEINKCLVRSDKEIGGYSEAHLDYDKTKESGHFYGNLSLDLPKANPDIVRSGYVMFRTRDPKPRLLDWSSDYRKYMNFYDFRYLALRVLGDNRRYFVNIQAESSVPTDLYQHRLFLRTPGQWETVLIPIDDFILTNQGIVQDQSEMNKQEIKSVGIGLIERLAGPFSLYIDSIKITNGLNNHDDNQFQSMEKSNQKVGKPLQEDNDEQP